MYPKNMLRLIVVMIWEEKTWQVNENEEINWK